MQPIIAGQKKLARLPYSPDSVGIDGGKESSGIPHAVREYPTYKGR